VTDTPVHVYDPDEAARILRCKASWLREKARRREIPFTLIGGAYRWTDVHLAEIIRLGEVDVTPSVQVQRRRTAATAESTPLLRARPPRKARSPEVMASPAPPGAVGATGAA
jgi:hypothetical protein